MYTGESGRASRLKRLAVTIAAVISLDVMPVPALALVSGEADLDLSQGSIVLTETGYSQAGGAETAHTQGYFITASGLTTNTIQVLSGAHDISLAGVTVEIPPASAADSEEMDMFCAFHIADRARVTLTLEGANILSSASGYAGLYVAEGAELTIGGAGSLTTAGGAGQPSTALGTYYYGGGAGIGGNGHENSSSFGTIVIQSGSITAAGGTTAMSVNYGAGAGIGSGGSNGNDWSSYQDYKGTVIINGGTINTSGGACVNSSDTSGGSGIGSGGCNEEFISLVEIELYGGIVNATGNNDAAGVGAGANCHSMGKIMLGGGDINAHGGDEGDGSTWGGAGIGAGDNGWVSSISIGGDAKVFASAGGAAAGIGGGNNGGLWDFTTDTVGELAISGDAVVISFGGSSGTARGGAGIGAGRTMYPSSYLCNSGVITVEDSADVTAYAGINAQAIGVGSGYDYSSAVTGEDVLIIDDTINLQLFNRDTTQAAYTQTIQGSGVSKLIYFTLSDSGLGTFPTPGEHIDTTSGDSYTWLYSDGSGSFTLELYDGGTQNTAFTSGHVAFGNWAVLLEAKKNVIGEHIWYIRGYPDGTVQPDGNITRAEAATIFYRLKMFGTTMKASRPQFADVPVDAWYYEAVTYLAEYGIVSGYPDGSFRPNASITRAELATMAARYDELVPDGENPFSDIDGHWSQGFIISAANKGWVRGFEDGTFRPDNPISRAETVTLVNNVLDRRIHPGDIPADGIPGYTDFDETHWAYSDIIEASITHEYQRREDGYEIWIVWG